MHVLVANPWLHGLLYGVVLVNLLMAVGGAASWWERKFAARMQNRIGPNILGPFGILQWVADALKMMQKEDIVPREADRALFNLAPILPLFLVMATAAVIPFGGWWNADGEWVSALLVADLDIGVLWILALAGLMVFPTWMAGWASNNKYTLLSGMRAVAQGISYEIPLVMASLVPVVMVGSFSVTDIVAWQAENGWLIWRLPGIGLLAMLMFYVTSLAEANRIPFDIPEAESELVAGIMVEYTGLKFGVFLLAEYLHTLVAAALAAALFLGGPHMPFISAWPLGAISPLWMAIKVTVLFVSIYWVRWSLYRFRSDQLMELCWKWLVPISLALVMGTSLWVALEIRMGWS